MDELKKIRVIFKQSLPVFNALGDDNRQKLILLMLEPLQRTVAELAAETELSRPTVSHHLKILKDAHLITEKRVGTRSYYQPALNVDIMKHMQELASEIARIQHIKGSK